MFNYRALVSSGLGDTLLRDTLYFVETRNITFHLPADLVRQAKVYADTLDTSVNALVKELLEHKLSRETRVRAAAERLLALAEQGPYSSVDPGSIRREEIYER